MCTAETEYEQTTVKVCTAETEYEQTTVKHRVTTLMTFGELFPTSYFIFGANAAIWFSKFCRALYKSM